jgi:hypothetical protein
MSSSSVFVERKMDLSKFLRSQRPEAKRRVEAITNKDSATDSENLDLLNESLELNRLCLASLKRNLNRVERLELVEILQDFWDNGSNKRRNGRE